MEYKKIIYGQSRIGDKFFWYLPTDITQRLLQAKSQKDADIEVKKEIDKIVGNKLVSIKN